MYIINYRLNGTPELDSVQTDDIDLIDLIDLNDLEED